MDPRLTGLDFETLLHSLADFLMPRVCLVCGRQLLAQERHLCLECAADLPLTHFEGMLHNPMADRLNALVEAPRYVHAVALFYYGEGYGRITRALKYGRNFAAGRYFARMLGERMAASDIWKGVEAVCPVPLHPLRRYRRGYNQAEVVGCEIAGALGARFEPGLLRRVRRTDSQTKLSESERKANVAGAFAVRRGASRYGRILLIDDVFTTGATLAACHAALREGLGSDVLVDAATLAYVEE